MRRERTNAELVEAMEKILRESHRNSQLIDNLLLPARADSDEEALKPGPVPVNSVLREAVERAGQLATGRNIQLSTQIDETPIDVNGETTLLQRLFFIIIDDAVKYTPENGTVNVSLHSNADYVLIGVADNGIGIAAEDLPHVSDLFRRADKVRSRDVGGTGLGLSIAKWIVEKSGGTLSVESEVGHGSKFKVRLPKSRNSERDRMQ